VVGYQRVQPGASIGWGLTKGADMWRKSVVAALAIALFSIGSAAAAPQLSGDYVFTMTILCQAGLAVTKNAAGQVTFLDPLYDARLESDIGEVSFDNVAKQASFSGVAGFGETLQIQHVSGPPTNMHQAAVTSLTQSYSNTNNTLTLGTDVYHVFYGKVTGGIVQNVVFQRTGGPTPNKHCTLTGSAFRK
jgi:hypothetical protein